MANKDAKNVKRFIEDISTEAAESTYGMFSSVDLSAANVYEQALKAYNANTLVQIISEDDGKFVADTITQDAETDDIIITKGGKTITIANDNTITNVGDIQNHLYLIDFRLTSETADYDLRITAISTKENITLDDLSTLEYVSIANDDTYGEVYTYIYNIQEYQKNGDVSTYSVEEDTKIIGLRTIKQLF